MVPVRFIVQLSVLTAVLPGSLNAYTLPGSDNKPITGQEVVELEKISRGIAAIAKEAQKAIVFVSIEKTIRGQPFSEFNPFEFFFGPGGPQQPGGRGQGQPQAERKLSGLGSGFFVDVEKGYMITNNHVIEGADEINLKLANGKTYSGIVVGRDKRTDVAVVKVKDEKFNRNGLADLRLDDSDKVQVGEIAIALGAPFGLESSLSFGIVSAVGREGLRITDLGSFIQTDAAINQGNSGGPLLNARGEVIGVNTAITSPTGTYAGIGFSVPSNVVRQIAQSLINEGKVDRGYIGIQMQELSDFSDDLNLPKDTEGVMVTHVEDGSPADKGGLRPQDVIVSVNGKAIHSTAGLANVIGLARPGDKVKVQYYRGGKEQSTTLGLAIYPDAKRLADADVDNRPNAGGQKAGNSGLELSSLSETKAKKLGAMSSTGVLIEDVEPESAGAKAQLRPGDIILNIDGQKVSKPDEVKAILASKGKKKFLLRIESEGSYAFRRLVM